ncbi:MAG TPA: cation:proton antiporter, partial [Dehalococcoidia bacterium]|nr:cation:proton antiporter [Dehalococcoidia bacterium]
TIIGFLVAGVVISPNTPGPVGNLDDITHAADIGVILLMFGIGIQFSFRNLLDYGKLTLFGGGGQIILTIAIGFLVGTLLGFDTEVAMVLGFLAANTSTIVVVKILEGRRQLKSVPGIAAINVCILQEFGAVLMVIIVPSFGGEAFAAGEIVLALLTGIALIAATYVLSTLVLPLVWRRIAYARSNELSLLAAIVLAVGLAAGSGLLGLSIAFGAFLAGLALSENEFGHATLSDVIPLRDIFASVFFISMGMLIDTEVLWDEPGKVLAIFLLFVVGKGFVAGLSLRLAGLTLGQAILTAVLLAQVGEFSFVIARVALEEGIVTDDFGSAFLLAAGLSILVGPGLVQAIPLLLSRAQRIGILSTLHHNPEVQLASDVHQMHRHVVICGYGDAAHSLVRSLAGRGLPFVIIENNPFIYQSVRKNEPDMPFIYGDATRPEVLELARIHEARVVAITFPNAEEVRIVAANARVANAGLDVVARGTPQTHSLLRRAGSSEVVDPEFEASLEFVRHVLHRFGVDGREIVALQTRWRAEYYRTE